MVSSPPIPQNVCPYCNKEPLHPGLPVGAECFRRAFKADPPIMISPIEQQARALAAEANRQDWLTGAVLMLRDFSGSGTTGNTYPLEAGQIPAWWRLLLRNDNAAAQKITCHQDNQSGADKIIPLGAQNTLVTVSLRGYNETLVLSSSAGAFSWFVYAESGIPPRELL